MDVNFELYKVFYAVATQGSISKGASQLRISQPAVTQAIQSLENQLGGKLFIRTPKGVTLTYEGNELYHYVQEGMSYFQNGTNKFLSLKNLEDGVIRIGATTSVSEYYLVPILKEFHQQYPHVRIDITNDLTDYLLQKLRNGSLDLVIMAIPTKKLKDLTISYLTDLNDIVVSNQKIDTRKKKDWDSFSQHPILLQKYPSNTRTNLDTFFLEHQLQIKPSMEVISQGLLIRLIEEGFGFGVVTKQFITEKLGKSLFEVPMTLQIPPRKLGIALKKNSLPSFTTAKLLSLLQKK